MSTTRLSRDFPRPYLCSDPGSFAEATLLVRLPDIARRMCAENHFPPEINRKIESLIAELPDRRVRDIHDPGAADAGFWKDYLAPYQGLAWRQLSFLVCENTFYRRILEATAYFLPGPTSLVDPYTYQKRLGLETGMAGIASLAARLDAWRKEEFPLRSALAEAIESNLWSNRADLSLWPAGASGTLPNTQLHQAEEFLLDNDLPEIVDLLCQWEGKPRRIDFLIDNAGFELVCDLALADLLLARSLAGEVHFHLKAHPTFVSDAITADVEHTLAFLKNVADPQISRLGQRAAGALSDGRLVLDAAYFWNSPLAGWEMPEILRNSLSESALAISKGDANYRRLLGDLRWPETTPFAQVTAYFPTRLVALRTSKSEVMVGLSDGMPGRLDQKEPAWRTNGRWGMIQLK